MRKKKRKSYTRKNPQTESQAKASGRNWSKGVIKGMIAHAERMKNSKSLTFKERVKVTQCKIILEAVMKNWKPTI